MLRRSLSRRRFLATTAAAAAFPTILTGKESVLGHGDFKYRLVPDWGVLGPETPVKNCHGIVCTREGHIILLTDEVKNNVIVYDSNGKLLHKWGHDYPGAHGLSLVVENDREVLYFTDLTRGMVFKATLSGEILNQWKWPEASGKYDKSGQYRPSWTLHAPGGDFFVLDGYGRDYIMHYAADSSLKKTFGGKEGGIKHWGPHGGITDLRDPAKPALLIAMSDQQHLLRLGLDGSILDTTPMPGGNPRQIHQDGNHFFVAHLADNWPADRKSRGFVSILDHDLRVIANIAGSAPDYDDDGKLLPMKSTDPIFMHPHDLTTGQDGSLYVAQFDSGNTYPLKLERV